MTYPDTRLFIAGTWQDAADGKTLAVINPSTGLEIGRVAHAGIADLDRALAAAQSGFEAWRDVPAIERAKIMRRAGALMRERADAIAPLLSQEQGQTPWPKPRSKSCRRPTSSNGLPTKACGSMAASCPPATWPCARWC